MAHALQSYNGLPVTQAIPMLSKNGTVLSEAEREEIAHKRGLCLRCGIKTHEVKGFFRTPLDTEHVYHGICIRDYPDDVPPSVSLLWKMRPNEGSHPPPSPSGKFRAAVRATTAFHTNDGVGSAANATFSLAPTCHKTKNEVPIMSPDAANVKLAELGLCPEHPHIPKEPPNPAPVAKKHFKEFNKKLPQVSPSSSVESREPQQSTSNAPKPPQPKELPNPATVAKKLFKEFNKKLPQVSPSSSVESREPQQSTSNAPKPSFSASLPLPVHGKKPQQNNTNKVPIPTVTTPQPKEPPNPATVAKKLFKEFDKKTTDWSRVRQWVKKCPDACKEKKTDGWLPLHLAFSKNAPLDVIQLLVETWPEAVQEKTNFGFLPLHRACFYNSSLDVIQLLLETWPTAVKVKDWGGSLPLHDACAAKAPLDVIQLLVKTWPEAVKEKDKYGSLPLHCACSGKAPIDVVKLLVEMWPQSINKIDIHDNTPLACAKDNGADELIVSWLAKRAAQSSYRRKAII